jgi:hypothetical protein
LQAKYEWELKAGRNKIKLLKKMIMLKIKMGSAIKRILRALFIYRNCQFCKTFFEVKSKN